MISSQEFYGYHNPTTSRRAIDDISAQLLGQSPMHWPIRAQQTPFMSETLIQVPSRGIDQLFVQPWRPNTLSKTSTRTIRAQYIAISLGVCTLPVQGINQRCLLVTQQWIDLRLDNAKSSLTCLAMHCQRRSSRIIVSFWCLDLRCLKA